MRCLVLAVLLSSCTTLDVTECASGLVCPAGTRCDDEHLECLSPDQETVCDGQAMGSPCETATIKGGTCRDELCLPARCGNAFVDPQEDCDDGNTSRGDGCDPGCVLPTNAAWTLEPIAPIGSQPHGAVYDPVTDAVVYVAGGFVWAWDGTWRVLGEAPRVSNTFTLVYDSTRDRLVLIDFTWEVYEWDRVEWTQVVDFGVIETPNAFEFDAAYDSVARRIVVVAAGLDEAFHTFSLDPTTWTPTTEVAPVGPVPIFASVSLAFNDTPHVLVLVAGTFEPGEFAQVFERTAGTWTRAPDAPPMLERQAATVRFVPGLGVLAVGGGSDGAVSRWNPTGPTWTALAALPYALHQPVVSHHPVRGAFVLGEQATNVLELVASSWVDRGPLAPPLESACAFDVERNRVIVHGPDLFGEQTWQWDLASGRWSRIPDLIFGGSSPSSLVYDPTRGVVLVAGATTYRLTDTWEPLLEGVFHLDAVALDAQQRLVGLGYGPQPVSYGVLTVPDGDLIAEAPQMTVFDLLVDPRSGHFVLQGDNGLFDHDGSTWNQAPLFGFFPLVADSERRSLLAISRTNVWERIAGEWYRREDIPDATASQVGACFDPVGREVFVLGERGGNPVLLRRTDRLPVP